MAKIDVQGWDVVDEVEKGRIAVADIISVVSEDACEHLVGFIHVQWAPDSSTLVEGYAEIYD